MAEFNPDAFLNKYSEKSDSGFDPDAFLEKHSKKDSGPSKLTSAVRKFIQGGSGGLSDEVAGGVEAAGRVVGLKGLGGPMKDISLDSPTLDYTDLKNAYQVARDQERLNLKKDTEINPKTSLAFEILGGGVSPANKLVKGMSVVKQGAALGGLYGYGTSESDSVMGDVGNAAKGTALGVLAGKGFDKLGKKLSPAITEASEKAAEKISPALAKQNKEQIIAAADRLGIKVTPGMLDDTGFVERLESVLAKSPSLLGQRINRAQKQAYSRLQDVVSEATNDATALTEYEVGERVKSGISSKLGERLDPVSALFDQVRESTRHIPISQKSKDAIIRNIQNTDEYILTGGGKANQYIEMLGRAQNADQVKTMMTMLNSDIQAAQGAERQVLQSVKNKFANLEENSVMRAAIAQAREGGMNASTGKKIGADIVNDLRDARNQYRQIKSDISDINMDARLGKNYGPSSFLDTVEKLPSEKMQQRFFNTDNQRQLQNLAKNFPDEFELLRQGKLRDIADSAIGEQGKTSVKKFLNQVDKLSPEAKEIVFRGNGQIIDDVLTLNNSLPRNFNPSGTASEMGWQDAIYRNVKDIPTYLLYKGASTNLGKQVGNKLQNASIDGLQEVAASSVKKLSNPSARLTGYAKWESDGASKLIDSGLLTQDQIEQLKKSKKGKELLIRASTPMSKKGMDNLIGEIQQLGKEQ